MDAILERLTDALPADFAVLRDAARAEAFRFLDRLADGWADGSARFDRPGELLLVARSAGALLAVGGLTHDVADPAALRMRRFYVLPTARRHGLGRRLALALLATTSGPVVLNAARGSEAFWITLGFLPAPTPTQTHRHPGASRPHIV